MQKNKVIGQIEKKSVPSTSAPFPTLFPTKANLKKNYKVLSEQAVMTKSKLDELKEKHKESMKKYMEVFCQLHTEMCIYFNL